MESSHIVDYELYRLPGVDFTLRGPQWAMDAQSPSVSFLGAAQTFGAFSKYPFPNLLGEMLSARVLNFGRGGAGAGYYTNRQAVIDYINETDLCIVQVMSARSSVENAYMQSTEGLTSVRILKGRNSGRVMLGHLAYKELAEELSPEDFFELIKQTREGFIRQYQALAEAIKVPKILLYVGRGAPLKDVSINERWKSNDLLGNHPHMVTQGMISTISQYFDETVFSYGPEGFNQRLVNRFTGDYASIKRSETYTVNKHNTYISPYLHTKASLDLYDVANEKLQGRKKEKPKRRPNVKKGLFGLSAIKWRRG